MDPHDILPSVLQQWDDARARLYKAIQVYYSATKLLGTMCTPSKVRLLAGFAAVIENHLQSMEHEELHLHKATIVLKQARNASISLICALPSELLATIFKAVTVPTPYNSSKRDVKNLSQVCSLWRQIALDVCPVWDTVTLSFDIDVNSERKPALASIELYGNYYRNMEVSVRWPLGFDDTQYAQTVLDTVAPNMKRLNRINITVDAIEQIWPFLELWLEKRAPGSLTTLDFEVARVFPETNSHLIYDLSQALGQVEFLSLSSVVLDWSSSVFNRLKLMSLSNLPIFCCPTLAQLARMISTCPHLQTLYLERIMIPTSTDVMLPEPVALDHLGTLVLKEVDITRVLPILSPGPSELGVQIRDITDDANTLESWYSFAGKANICELDLTLSETRSNQALARLLYSAISLLPSLKCLTLVDMDLRDSELIAVASHFLAPEDQTLPSLSISTAGGLSPINSLIFWSCTIRTTSTALHNVVSAIRCTDLRLEFCKHLLTTQGENGITETLEPISVESDFGIRLCGLMPNRVSFD